MVFAEVRPDKVAACCLRGKVQLVGNAAHVLFDFVTPLIRCHCSSLERSR